MRINSIGGGVNYIFSSFSKVFLSRAGKREVKLHLSKNENFFFGIGCFFPHRNLRMWFFDVGGVMSASFELFLFQFLSQAIKSFERFVFRQN